MRSQINRHPFCEESDINAVIGIEATQKILIDFPSPFGMFDGNEPGNQAQYLCRTALRLEKNFFVPDELLSAVTIAQEDTR
ncbi:MAG: hypothetical protein ABI988_11080 [Nitrospirota bacterium]